MSGNALLDRIDAYAQAIRERRPLTPDEVKELDAYFRIGMTYTSNALEGNSLTLSETKVLLEDGITVGGKPIRDCYEATGHARAYDYMYIPPTAEEVPGLMAGLVEDLNKRKDATHPVLLAAYAHRRLVDIHPFRDGNGRTARLLMNLILVNRGYCVVSIPPILRHDYITALQQAQRAQGPSDAAFIKLICECELEAQKDYCRMFRIKLPER